MKLSVSVDKSRFIAMNAELKRQMPFVTSLAVNNVAKRIRLEEMRQITHIYKNPTPFTQRSVLYDRATKSKPFARVFIRDKVGRGNAPVKYMGPEVYGTDRRLKRFERALIARRLMPRGMFAMPGDGARLNKYGNLTQGLIRTLLDQVKPMGQRGAGSKYFVGNMKGVLGIWQRFGRGGHKAKPIIVYTRSQPTYQSKLPFHRIAAGVAATHFKNELNRALAHAVETSRKKASNIR